MDAKVIGNQYVPSLSLIVEDPAWNNIHALNKAENKA